MVETLLFPDLTSARGALIPKEVVAVETQGHCSATDAGARNTGGSPARRLMDRRFRALMAAGGR